MSDAETKTFLYTVPAYPTDKLLVQKWRDGDLNLQLFNESGFDDIFLPPEKALALAAFVTDLYKPAETSLGVDEDVCFVADLKSNNRYGEYTSLSFETHPQGFYVQNFRSEGMEYYSESFVISHEEAQRVVNYLIAHLANKEKE